MKSIIKEEHKIISLKKISDVQIGKLYRYEPLCGCGGPCGVVLFAGWVEDDERDGGSRVTDCRLFHVIEVFGLDAGKIWGFGNSHNTFETLCKQYSFTLFDGSLTLSNE